MRVQLQRAVDFEPREAARRLPGQSEACAQRRDLRAHRRPRAQEQQPSMSSSMKLRKFLVRPLVDDERGIALVMALGILIVCTIMVTTVIMYTSSGQRTSY